MRNLSGSDGGVLIKDFTSRRLMRIIWEQVQINVQGVKFGVIYDINFDKSLIRV